MSGGSIPYHLRLNKFVDRQLFLECLERLISFRTEKVYGYATLGGPFLADLKAVHSKFGIKNLISIESDGEVFTRQKFNKPLALIDCERMDTGDFVTNYDSIIGHYACDNWAIWLDYVSPKQRERQLGEVSALVSKLTVGDVLRVTLNAAPHTLANRENFENYSEYQSYAFDRLKANLGRFFPNDTEYSAMDMTLAGLSEILLSAIRVAMIEGLSGKATQLRVLPICAFRYSDGPHQMITLTATIAEINDRIEENSKMDQWPYFTGRWTGVREIRLPDLSVKERIAIDELIFSDDVEKICLSLPFSIGEKTKDLVSSYIEHYRRYPSFLQVHI